MVWGTCAVCRRRYPPLHAECQNFFGGLDFGSTGWAGIRGFPKVKEWNRWVILTSGFQMVLACFTWWLKRLVCILKISEVAGWCPLCISLLIGNAPRSQFLEDTALTRSAWKDLINTLQNAPQCASMFCDYAKENITGGKGCDVFFWAGAKNLHETVLILLQYLTSMGLEAFVEGMRKTSVLSRHKQQLEEGYRCCCRTKQYQDRPECRGGEKW